MTADFRLPDLGEGLTEAEIVHWHIAEGDEIALNETLVEVETAKAVVEIPSPFAGVVGRLHASEGETVEVGALLVAFETGGAAASGPERSAAAPMDEERPEPNLVGYGASRASARPQRRPRTGRVASDADTAVVAAAHDVVRGAAREVRPPAERPRSTPPVRKLAKDLGVDLETLATRDPGGLVTREDVEAYAREQEPAMSRTDARVTRAPIRGVRKHTASAMVRSAFTAPQATTFLTIDVTPTVELIGSLKRDRALDGHRIGILAIVAKAICLALRRTPELNSRWDEEAGDIVTHHYVNLGIAAATDRGLVVPHVADADRLDLVDLADAIGELVDTARQGRTSPATLTGGTFTITNVGVLGVDAGTPILNPGEAGILALGAVRRIPWEYDGTIALRDVLTLSLSFDHRLVDGAEAARFLTDVATVLREPGRALLLA